MNNLLQGKMLADFERGWESLGGSFESGLCGVDTRDGKACGRLGGCATWRAGLAWCIHVAPVAPRSSVCTGSHSGSETLVWVAGLGSDSGLPAPTGVMLGRPVNEASPSLSSQ